MFCSLPLCLSIRSSVTKQTCERGIFTSEPILMQLGTSGPWDKGVKRSTLGVRRSKVKVTQS